MWRLAKAFGRRRARRDLAGVARDLAYLDVQGGRPVGASGPHGARNARLHLPARRPRPPARSRRRAPRAAPAGSAPGAAGAFTAVDP